MVCTLYNYLLDQSRQALFIVLLPRLEVEPPGLLYLVPAVEGVCDQGEVEAVAKLVDCAQAERVGRVGAQVVHRLGRGVAANVVHHHLRRGGSVHRSHVHLHIINRKQLG